MNRTQYTHRLIGSGCGADTEAINYFWNCNGRMKFYKAAVTKGRERRGRARDIWRRDFLEYRARLKKMIDVYSEHGRVAIVYGFIDCDMSRADGLVDIINANTIELYQWIESFEAGAEGRQWWNLDRPSEVGEITATHRDLMLEAFEDGHPHCVYY